MKKSSENQKSKMYSKLSDDMNSAYENKLLQNSLEININVISLLFKDVDIVKYKYVKSNFDKSLSYCLVYSDGMVDSYIINENIIKPLLESPIPKSGSGLISILMEQVLQINEMVNTNKLKDIIEAIAYGDTVLFAENQDQALILNTKNIQTREITEPENEKFLSGPREGFSESLTQNISLLRKRVLTSDLKIKMMTFGKRTQTKACICYFGELVNDKILNELHKRLGEIDIDSVLDTNYISELIKDSPASPFRTIGNTEKPDTVLGKLLEGRIAILVDGSPKALTLPYLFIENFQSGEDYYLNYYYTSFTRFIRFFGFLLTVTVPGLYVSIVAFHHEMVPTQLLINIAADRHSVPLPAALEAFIMLIIFDILKETGIRVPTNIGQAFSIVGALVIGQSAVEAKLVAAPMIVVIGLTGITNLLVPKLIAPVIYVRFLLLFLSSGFGFLGFVSGISIAMIHILNLRSFGVPQVMLTGDLRNQDIKDSFYRAPWHKMLLRPVFAKDRVRQKNEKNSKS